MKLHIFIDACSVEVFGNDGETMLTSLIFPHPTSTGVKLYGMSNDVRVTFIDIGTLQEHGTCSQHDLQLLFLPTGALQETSIDNGWKEEFLQFATEFEYVIDSAQ